MSQKQITINIAPKSVILTITLIAGALLLYYMLDIVIITFIALLFAAAINPFITKLEHHGFPRPVGIMMVYILFLVLLTLFAVMFFPPFVNQLVVLLNKINIPPDLLEQFTLRNLDLINLQIIADQVGSLPKLASFVGQAFSLLVVLFTTAVISFYMLMERHNLHKYLVALMGDNTAEKQAEKIVDEFEHQVGGWVRGELTLMVVIGVMTYIGLLILDVQYAFPLAVLAGLLEIFPNIGPTLAALPAIIVAYLTVSPLMALIVALLYFVIQQLENNFIVPMVMKRAIDINPIVTILLILSGFKLAGAIGAVLSIPVFLVLKITYLQWRQYSHTK